MASMEAFEAVDWFGRAALIPSLPKVALDLIETLRHDEPDFKRLGRGIEADPALCARVLRLANTPYYAPARPIRSVADALLVLGFAPARNLALSAAVSSLGKSVPGMDMGLFARSTMLGAVCAESVASEAGMERGEAFAAGRLRPIGLLLMRGAGGRKMAGIDERFDQIDPRRAGAEREAFGVDHCGLSAALARRWRLPDAIVGALAGEGRPGAGALLAQWAASRAIAGPERHAQFDAHEPAVEWARALGFPGAPRERAWPGEEQAKERFGSFAQ